MSERVEFLAGAVQKDIRQFLKDEGFDEERGLRLDNIECWPSGEGFGVHIEGLDVLRVVRDDRGGEEYFYLRSIRGENAGTENWRVQFGTNDPSSLSLVIGALLRVHLMGERR